MPSILDAEVKKHESFDFVKYTFSNLSFGIDCEKFRDFLYYIYEELTKIKLEKNINIIFDNINSEQNNIQQIIFYGDSERRKGFESIYSRDLDRKDKRFWYIFDQTVMDNFFFYFYINPDSFLKNNYIITEVVVYMAKYFNEKEHIYDEKFNLALMLIKQFLS